jgi:uncharacterized protein YvpB
VAAGIGAALIALILGIQRWLPGGSAGPPPPTVLEVQAGDRSLARLAVPPELLRQGAAAELEGFLQARLPERWTVSAGRARITYSLGADEAARRLGAGAPGTHRLAARPRSAVVSAPVVAQEQRNTCESAALEILLASAGVRVPQGELQRALPTDGPLDPVGSGSDRVWGDPELGYVGRPDGGGLAGGFGVYQRPVAAVARRYGVALEDLTGRTPAAIYERLLAGRAVMAWVGLSDGPHGSWRSPTGRPVRVNFGEHTVVLNGIARDGGLLVVNPLEGTREVWSRARFVRMWDRLDRRALATAADLPDSPAA